jgi:quercetin dioxygenase-like cupin family protein
MKTLVVLFGLLLAASAIAAAAPATTDAATPTVVNYAEYPLKVGGSDYTLITIVQDFPPGTGIAPHRHGANLLVTVMSGALTLHERGGDRVVKAGESFTESPGNVHSVDNMGPDPVRIAVSVLLPKGQEITTMVSDKMKM